MRGHQYRSSFKQIDQFNRGSFDLFFLEKSENLIPAIPERVRVEGSPIGIW
jgi:hypothetical protein